MAVPWIWSIDQTRLTAGNEPDGYDLCLDSALVSNIVHMAATTIEERHSSCVDVWSAIGIVGFVLRDRSRGDDDQGCGRVGVPTRAPPGLPDIAQHVRVGLPDRLLERQPQFSFIAYEVIADVKRTDLAFGDRCARETIGRRRQRTTG